MGRIFVRTSLYLCQSARLELAKLTGKGESRDNIVSMNLWSEKKCPSETAQFLTAPKFYDREFFTVAELYVTHN